MIEFNDKSKKVLLECFRPEFFNKLSEEYQKSLILAMIDKISNENNIEEINITFEKGRGFYFMPYSKTLNIELEPDTSMGPYSYLILNNIIHELRHCKQNETNIKHEFSHDFYAITDAEIDAHDYTAVEMHKLEDFFNDDNFRRFNELIDDQTQSLRDRIYRQLDFYGYREKTPYEYKNEYVEYCMKNACKFIDSQKTSYLEDGVYSLSIDIDNQKIRCEYLDQETGLVMCLNFSNDEANLTSFYHIFTDEKQAIVNSKDIERIFLNICKIIEECNDEYNCNINKISFAPMIPDLNINIYNKILNYLKINDTKISLIKNLNLNFPREELIFLNFKREFACFGNNYYKDFTKEQRKVLDQVAKYIYPFENEDVNISNKELCLSEYKKEYTPDKLMLIFKSQKIGLDTSFYESYNEEEIRKIQKVQIRNLQYKINASLEDILLDAGISTSKKEIFNIEDLINANREVVDASDKGQIKILDYGR